MDFDRACSEPERRCWLCTELTPWNQAMHELGFELVEPRPGKLRLRPIWDDDRSIEQNRAPAAEASLLISRLLQQHRCIEELKVACQVYSGFAEQETSFPIRLRPALGSGSRRTIRRLEVQTSVIRCREVQTSVIYRATNDEPTRERLYQLEDLAAVGGLERLKLEYHGTEREFAVELAMLLRRSAGSIKRLEISHTELPRQVTRALRYLFNCESLTISSLWGNEVPSARSVARLLHSSTALKELSITGIASTTQISAIAKELENNTSLTKLRFEIGCPRGSSETVFTALQVNTTLKELSVTDCCITEVCGQALALMLQNNTGLRLLHIGDADISERSLLVLASALTRNTTLESLHLSSEGLPVNGIVELCKVLRINKTLKMLQFGDETDHPESRAALARQLAQDECYGRVQLPWTIPDLPGLTAALTSSLAGIQELCLPDMGSLCSAGLKQLLGALACSKCVRTFRAAIMGNFGNIGAPFCEMLKVNRSIDCLDLTIYGYGHEFVKKVSYALAENVSITKMVLTIGVNDCKLETMSALSYLLAHNKMATNFFLECENRLSPKFLEEFSQGLLHNKAIVKFKLVQDYGRHTSLLPHEAVRRNRSALNRAVDFVISPSRDRQCAEGFEQFSGRPCLLKQLKKVSGKTEPEALLAIGAAQRYLLYNYLLITGIVQHSVQCHPSNATQVDALNKDCWLAISRHLKVADVLS